MFNLPPANDAVPNPPMIGTMVFVDNIERLHLEPERVMSTRLKLWRRTSVIWRSWWPRGALQTPIVWRGDWGQLPEAIELLAARRISGKAVLRVR